MHSLSRRAAAAAVSCAQSHGLEVRDARILGASSNTLVELVPHGIVARVASGTGLVRQGTAWLAHEVAVCGYLAAAGAPCARPSDRIAPGPHEHDGFAISFWERLEALAEPVGPDAAGALLRRCHDALAGCEARLPALGIIEETLQLTGHPLVTARLDEEERALLRRGADRLRSTLEGAALPLRPLHGDAHPGNMLATASGPLLIDWEDCFAGPAEWDLACLVGGMLLTGDEASARQALAGYGAPHDRERLELMLAVRNLQGVVWGALRLDAPRANPRWRARLHLLSERP